MSTIGRRDWIWLFSVWAVVQLCWLNFYGIYTQEEAGVYINIAHETAHGDFSQSVHFWLYAGYIAPLTLISWLDLPVEVMYGIQLLLGMAGMWAFVKILCAAGIRRIAVIAGGLLFATSPLFQSWNSHLYTDAYWGNITVVLIFLIQRFATGNHRQFFLLFTLLVLGCFIRPVGFLMIPITIIYLWLNRAPVYRIVILTVWLLAMAFFIQYALAHGTNFFYPNHNLELNIICGLPSELARYEQNPYQPGMSIPAYFFANPELALRLFASRLLKTLWMTRPYFSSSHNVMLAITCALYYALAVPGIFYIIRKKFRQWFYIISGMVIWLIPNIVFCADWHNRFMVPFIPFLLITATFGIEFVLSKAENQKGQVS